MFHSPLNYAALVPKDRRLIITGLGDRLAPPQQAEVLWEHWDRCAFHWFPGNHILHVSQPDYLRRMTRFMRDYMFTLGPPGADQSSMLARRLRPGLGIRPRHGPIDLPEYSPKSTAAPCHPRSVNQSIGRRVRSL